MKVLRVLVFEGSEEWINWTLEKSWLRPNSDQEFLAPAMKATEILRTSDPMAIDYMENEIELLKGHHIKVRENALKTKTV